MNQTDIQRRLYKTILLVGAGLSVVSIAGNLLGGFPFLTSAKWAALFVITLFAFFFSDNEKCSRHIRFGVFVFLICVFLPFAFVDSGGSSNNAIGYTFLLLITTTYLFDGWRRRFLIAALIAAFMLLHALEYYRPEIIAVYSPQAQFIDRMIQIPLLLWASFRIILKFAREHERVNRKLNELAKCDELTGLYNRRMFDREIDSAFGDKKRPAHLVFLDLNNFKRVNDNCGHAAGDRALKELARLLQAAFGPGGHVVSRWGGDEFAIIYFGGKSDLAEKIDWVRAEFSSFVTAYEKTAGISTSIVSFSDYGTIPQMFAAADAHLYEKKQLARGA